MNKAGISRVNWLILDVEGAHLTDAMRDPRASRLK
jgi:hypothetical protein